MRKSTILSVLINPQVPDDCRKQDNRRLHEEITLFLYPGLVQIEHNRVGGFVGIRDVCHEFRIDGITPVRAVRIIKIYHVKFGLYLVFVKVLQQFIVGDNGEVIEFIIINIDGKSFGNLLFDVIVYDGITLA